jgi:hypothetical protein
VATEPLASNATIRTRAAKIEIDALRVDFRIFDIVGLLIVKREAVASLRLGGGSSCASSPRDGKRCSHSASIEAEHTGHKDERQ